MELRYASPRLERNHTTPMGCSLFIRFGRCSQGGGVHVNGGEVTFQSSQINDNHATYTYSVSFPPFEHPIAPLDRPICSSLAHDYLLHSLGSGQ